MGNTSSMNKINFEDIQYSLDKKETFLIINTLSETEQDCLLPNTISPEKEISIINNLIKTVIVGKLNFYCEETFFLMIYF